MLTAYQPGMTLREIALASLPPSLTHKRTIDLCKQCVRNLKTAGYERDSQLWGCVKCGCARGWGFAMPEDAELRPVLRCEGCERATRHGYLGVIGRSL